MNKNGIRQFLKKWALPSAVCCMVLAGAAARAQTAGDIVSIYSDQANTTYTASGTDVDIKIRLWGDFRRYSVGGIEALLPQIRLVINGDIAWATLYTLNRYDFGGIYKTEAVFRYRVRPGDMAQPMKLFGNAGSGLPGDAFQFYWNGWEIRNASTTSNAVWRYNPSLMGAGDILDEDFTKAKVVLRTLSFDSVISPDTVAATESVFWRVTTVNPVETGNVVDFYVWSPSSNVRLGASVGDPLLVSMPQGATQTDFPVYGVTPGTAEIYLQRAKDYQNNGSAGVTNFIKRTITVTAAPDPTVSIRMKSSGSELVTLGETGSPNTGSLYVDLSQPYAAPVMVRLDLSNMQAGETNVTFVAQPMYVDIPAGATSSSEVFFNVPDGTVWSAGSGIVVTPVITNAAAAVYTRTRPGKVYVQNAAPRIIEPLSTDSITVTRGVPHAFTWTADDVSADLASGMVVTWTFGDGTFTNVNGSAGSVMKTYATAGSRTVKVKAVDKDGGVSSEVQFNVEVVPPEPSPYVRVVPSAYEYKETTTNATGSLKIQLSEAFTEDVYVRLNTLPAGQSNLLISATGAIRIPLGTTENTTLIKFSLPDGSQLSEISGIEIVPEVVNAAAAAHFTDMQSTVVFVNNQPPSITSPVANVERGPVPSGVPYVFNYVVKDVNADLKDMLVHWRFMEGGALTTVTGAVGAVSYTYLIEGTHTVWVQAEDKDGGLSGEVEFTIVVGPPPTVTIITPSSEVPENATGVPAQIGVRLSAPFTEAVTVNLGVTPANNDANGTLTLSAYSVVIPAGVLERTVSINNSSIDGTVISRSTGFTITPTVGATPSAVAFYSMMQPGYVYIRNEAPYFISSSANTEAVVDTAQSYSWSVSDVALDRPTLQVTWTWGDGTSDTITGSLSGSIPHTYTAAGTYNVRIEVRDKDDEYAERLITVVVRAAKALNVTPIGPNTSGYYGAGTTGRGSLSEGANTGGGIGYGKIIPRQPIPTSANNFSDVYYFRYSSTTPSASIEALPYKTDLSGQYNVTRYDAAGVANPTAIVGVRHDSFFLCWDGGTDEGLTESDLTPATANNMTVVALPAASAGTATEPASDAEIRRVRAIFSREWIASDNVGDINKDGIPDDTAMWLLGRIEGGDNGGGGGGDTPAWLQPLDTYNDDLDKLGGTAVGDFYPVNPHGILGIFDFRPTGQPFIAFNEVRGLSEGLNRKSGMVWISDPFGPEDEPGTDPTLADTDGDGLPDGWEYWFWRAASFGFDDAIDGDELTGAEYDPGNVAQGKLIPSSAIVDAFQPAVHSGDTERDFDKDGLKDVEELLLGTNPTHWDTDGDGICDGWELFRGLNPCDPRDGKDTVFCNTDGDFMAYAIVPRQLVTLDIGEETPKTVLGVDAVVGTNSGTFAECYYYGTDEKGLLAVGVAYTPPTNAVVVSAVSTNALLLHFQVMHAFGFDPRTAWTGSVNVPPLYNRIPEDFAVTPNTKPFTALDEYLLLKFMSELGLNGATKSMEASADVWEQYSTHPLTPDSDITMEGDDGMPDGWELYVGIRPGADMTVLTNRYLAISPWNYMDGALDADADKDGLVNRREFAGTDSSAVYTDPDLYNMTNRLGNFVGQVSVTFHAPDIPWINKFWPTNPWLKDSDGDGVADSAESAFIYGEPVDSYSTCTQGGGLNPNAVDTDLDGLPDAWESAFAGTAPGGAGPFSGMAITNGMDGTVSDHDQDWDFDGLKNYQEYWVQSVRGFRYDIPAGDVEKGAMSGQPGLPMDTSFDIYAMWTPVTNVWDVSRYPWGKKNRELWFMLPVGYSKLYVCTDPRDHDTDKDGMDDYYELFHGLNPILGHGILGSGLDDRVARAYIKDGGFTIDYLFNDWGFYLPMDFVQYPWLAGMPGADPDADGLLNLEEKLQADMAAPANYNTDPSPIWMTDYSSPESLTSRFYYFNGMYFWPGDNATVSMLEGARMSMFTFEMNEGYDTDNDGVSDKVELQQSSTASSSPQDHDDPVRRQALWFDGVRSAAQTRVTDYHGAWAFRSFTLELWACPATIETAEGQVLVERPVFYDPADISDPAGRLRHNYRIGIEPDGRVYAMFENAGGHDEQTGFLRVHGRRLNANEWVHLSAVMDGAAGLFTLYVTEPRSGDTVLSHDVYSVETDLIPANGIMTVVEQNAADGSTSSTITYVPAPIVLGAACISPDDITSMSWGNYNSFFHGYLDEVRIWDGARSELQIYADRTKRYGHNDLLANRLAVYKAEYEGGSRKIGNTMPVPPELVYCYNFDNLFGADRAESVAKTPRGFNHPDVAGNRPDGYVVGWLANMALRSTVYDDYGYITWIENGVKHLPLFGFKGLTSGELYPYVDKVTDSVYWSHTAAGMSSKPDYAIYEFPNQGNPYGFNFRHQTGEIEITSRSEGAELQSGDLLPLGGAFALRPPNLWDADTAGSVWADTGDDTDADGMPDWWEAYVETLYPGADLGWYDYYPDGSGMTAGERYLRDLALGWTETNNPGSPGYNPGTLIPQTGDIDKDGLPDWWEALYNLKIESALSPEEAMNSRYGSLGDIDRDGLSNQAEYLISEHYRFRTLSPIKFKSDPVQKVSDYFLKEGLLYYGQMFADHDFMEDSWEDNFHPYYASRFVYDAHFDNDQDGWSNWSEARFGATARRSDPGLGSHLSPEGFDVKDFPVPVIEARLSYNGIHQEGGDVVIHAFSNPRMDGSPDAVFTLAVKRSTDAKTKYLGFWGPKSVKGVLSPGSIMPGTIRFVFNDTTPRPAVNVAGLYWGVPERAVEAAFDTVDPDSGEGRMGLIKARNVGGALNNIGSIDYTTGEYEIDFALMEGWVLRNMVTEDGVLVMPELDVNDAYIIVSYEPEQILGWPQRLYLSDADPVGGVQPSLGYVKEGANHFFAFLDLDNNNQWGAGEPCGVAEGFAADIGWDRQAVNIELTDYTPGYLRMSLASGLRSDDIYLGGATAGGGTGSGAGQHPRVMVKRIMVDGMASVSNVFDKTFSGTRDYIHEGDLIASGRLALDWGLPGVANPHQRTSAVYEVRRGDPPEELITVFTNKFSYNRAKAVATYPANAYVYSSRPEFRWTMPDGYPAFAIEIKKNSTGGTTVYSAAPLQIPSRNTDGEYVWRAPIYANTRLPDGEIFTTDTVYYWRVMALNAKFANTTLGANWSDWKSFRLDVNRPIDSSGYGEIRARVKYHGPATGLLTGRVKVQAYDNAAFAGLPEAEYTLAGTDLTALTSGNEPTVNAVLKGLAPSSKFRAYYMRAFIDHNQNGKRDVWESWGYANYYGLTEKPYDPRAISVAYAAVSEVVDIVIEDADTDQDWFPDAWEFQINSASADFLTLTGPATGNAPDTEINPTLSATGLQMTAFFLTMSTGTTDQDEDGLGDLLEMTLGTDASATSSSGDGFSDGDKVTLGFDPNVFLTLNLTGLDLDADTAPTVNFDFGVAQPASGGSALMTQLSSMAAEETRDYEILYKRSLSDADWTVVHSGTVPVAGVQSLSVRLEEAVLQNLSPESGFFRIRLVQ